ncbi:hypothetical protein NVP2275O_030 [Vibrio phage 2.275.O._10N.286.54.E11]|nr:hypothetical protein NVP2275O_030 [Vibrio phage 2.275.O._10N.286.54.E11]
MNIDRNEIEELPPICSTESENPTPEQMKKFIQLMSRHKPGKDKEKAIKKVQSRKKAKMQKASKKKNRK